MSHIPSYKHLQKLVHVDLSGNHVEDKLDSIGDSSSSYHVQSLSCLNLSQCGLKHLPGLTNLVELTELNVSGNQINSLHSLESRSLKTLILVDNPFPVLNFSPDKLPSLNNVMFGSETSHFVCFSVLEKVSNRKLKLEVTESCKQKILIPLPHTLSDMEKLEKYLKNKELHLSQFNTGDPEIQMKCLEWLTGDGVLNYASLNLANETRFCASFEMSEIEDALSRLQNVKKLVLSKCSLCTIPDIRYLSQLKILDLENNNIDTFDNVSSDSVQEIKLQGNPIVGFDFDTKFLPNLKNLKMGSCCTRYLSLHLLDCIVNTPLKVECVEEYSSYLMYPTAACLKNKGSVRIFLQNASLNLTSIPSDARNSAFVWILEHCGSALKSLNMSIGFEREEEKGIMDSIIEIFGLEKSNLIKIESLYLRNLGLTVAPDLLDLKSLRKLDLGYNNIETFDNVRLPENLETLYLDGNPIDNVNMLSTSLEHLRELHCGSTCNFCISFPVIDKFVHRSLKLRVADEFLGNVLLPSSELLVNSERSTEMKVAWQRYIKSPEVFLHKLKCTELKVKALEWLLCNSGKEFTLVDFSGMEWIFDTSKQQTSFLLDAIFSDTLNNLKEINVSGCGTQNMEKLLCFPGAQSMNVSSNQLVSISGVTLDRLISLEVSDNPIEIIDFDPDCFPQLKSICFGSEKTTFVSQRVLRLFCEKSLDCYMRSRVPVRPVVSVDSFLCA